MILCKGREDINFLIAVSQKSEKKYDNKLLM